MEGSMGLEHSGRLISEQEVEQIRQTVELFPGLPLGELASTISEHLGWYTAGGTVKRDACTKLLLKLQAAGALKLSERQKRPAGVRSPAPMALSEATRAGSPIGGLLQALGPVQLRVVEESEERRLCNEYLQRYHPLGYKRPFGYRMRYWVDSPRGKLGCMLLAGAAKALGARDRWIGWSDSVRLQNLSWVVGNSRFLIFPWVEVKNLASHALGLLARRLGADWEARWGYRPVLMESFVDPVHRVGSCYKAAGWQWVGMSTGEGLVRPGASYTTTPKMIFLKPLQSDFRERLCSQELPVRVGWRDE
jgi:hypothetical protein